MSDKLESLAAVLHGGEVPQALQALNDEELAALTRSVEGLKQHQERELDRAVEDALSHIPALLRRSVRKMLFSE